MNKTAIKNFAIWARRKLISDITYKAGMLGITEKGIAQPLSQSTKDLQFFDIGTRDYAEVSGDEIQQRNALIAAIRGKEKGSDYKTAFRNVIEEVAYTWFNRLIAVRFMEVNDYLPSRIRVLSSENAGKLEPDFVTNPFDTDLMFTPYEKDVVLQLKEDNKLDELFRMLFIKQCNKLSEILPELFEQISDYTEILLNISFTDKDGVIYHLTHDISEDDFNVAKEGQVEIIGWLYQYYNTEPKDEVFALLKKNVKITKERIPAATQLFTPDWIVRYMVENSLGRLWVEGHPNDDLKAGWKYYLEEAEQELSVKVQLAKIRAEYAKINPEDIKVIDPCMGSGHILVYAFDVLMQIYVAQGYMERDAAKSILINNLYGIDIDTRAYQLAYFAVMMKARQYNRRIFSEGIRPNLIAVKNSGKIDYTSLKRLGDLESLGRRLISDFTDAEEYGSILQLNYTQEELDSLDARLDNIDKMADYGTLMIQFESIECVEVLKPLVRQARIMSQKYDVVVTNPPYMGNGNMSPKLSSYVKSNYNSGRNDLFAVFIDRCMQMIRPNRFQAMITQHQWMFLSSYSSIRLKILDMAIINMAHLGARAFEEIGGEVVQTTSFIILKQPIPSYITVFKRLVDYPNQSSKEEAFLSSSDSFNAKCKMLQNLPGSALAYWISNNMVSLFGMEPSDNVVTLREGIHTGRNEEFLRAWEEINYTTFVFNATNYSELDEKGRWVPYNKGGSYRKWYGNNELVIGFDSLYRDKMAKLEGHVRPSQSLYFKEGATWSALSSGKFGLRYYPRGFLFDSKGQVAVGSKCKEILGLFNLNAYQRMADMIMPTLDYKCGDVKKLPYCPVNSPVFIEIVDECILIAKAEWDSYETSWNFVRHPFCETSGISTRLISNSFERWKQQSDNRFQTMCKNEKRINELFNDQYHLSWEETGAFDPSDITLRKADLQRDIKSFISYAVGCMFGRYSLDVPGLAYAGGEWDSSKYKTFIPDPDNCIPITDEEYFKDDIVGRFVDFVKVVFGEDTLEENLNFIADALGNKGSTARNTIRLYFLNDFFKDHCQTYSVTGSGKRPIYWLFDSGKQNGFKALVYMHRWNADTVGNLRIEYLHKMQNVYDKEIDACQDTIDNSMNNREIAAATKRKEKLIKQQKECKDYDAQIGHIALSRIDIDLDDGVKVNYRKVQTGADGRFCEILADSKDIMIKEDSEIWQNLISNK